MSKLFFALILFCAVLPGGRAAAADSTTILAERMLESQTGQYAELFPGALPPELDKSVPLPQGLTLVGSAVLTPLQSYGQYGSAGTIEIYYDGGTDALRDAYLGQLEAAGWSKKRRPGWTQTAARDPIDLECSAKAPSVWVTRGPAPAQLHVSIARSRPGWDPCKN